jgi:hypothetical protein
MNLVFDDMRKLDILCFMFFLHIGVSCPEQKLCGPFSIKPRKTTDVINALLISDV